MDQNKLELAKQQAEVYKQKHQKVSGLLLGYKDAIANALPKFITPDRMIRVALTAMSKNPDLLNCTSHSLIGCILTSAQLGLLPDETLGEAYLIPFKNNNKGVTECTFVPGYRGLTQLAMRSGMVRSVQARPVFASDEFDWELGLNEKLFHKPSGEIDPAKITHFYAMIKFANGGHVFNVMTRQKIEQIRNEIPSYKFARDKQGTIWTKYFEDMGSKTVLRRLMKFAPLSSDVNMAVGLDEQVEAGVGQNLASQVLLQGLEPEVEDAVYAEIATEASSKEQERKDNASQTSAAKAAAAVDATQAAMNGGKPV